ncbi:hypothetical protein ACORG1_33510 (plasmid) [Mycobacterium sp. TJFP1]
MFDDVRENVGLRVVEMSVGGIRVAIMNNRVHETRPDPGPGYRWATRREHVVDALLGLWDLLLACAAGAIAGTVTLAAFAWVIPGVFATSSRAASELTGGDNGSAPSGVALAVEGITPWVGLAVGLIVAVQVTRTVARRQPLRGGPLRPDPARDQ